MSSKPDGRKEIDAGKYEKNVQNVETSNQLWNKLFCSKDIQSKAVNILGMKI